MTPVEFFEFVKGMRDPSVPEMTTYDYCEKIHKYRHGRRKYASYAVFKSARSRYINEKFAKLAKDK